MGESPLPVIIPNKKFQGTPYYHREGWERCGRHEHTIPGSHLEEFATGARLMSLQLIVTLGTRSAGANRRCMNNTKLL